MSTTPVPNDALDIASQTILPAILHLNAESTHGKAEMLNRCMANPELSDQSIRLQLSAFIHAYMSSKLLSVADGSQAISKVFRLMRDGLAQQANSMNQRERAGGASVPYPALRNLQILAQTLLEPRFAGFMHPELVSAEVMRTTARANVASLTDAVLKELAPVLEPIGTMQTDNKLSLLEACGESDNHRLLRHLIASGLLSKAAHEEDRPQMLYDLLDTTDISGACTALIVDSLSAAELREITCIMLEQNSKNDWRYATHLPIIAEAALTSFPDDAELHASIVEALNKFEAPQNPDLAQREIVDKFNTKEDLEALLQCASLLDQSHHTYALCAVKAMAKHGFLSEPADWEAPKERPSPQTLCQQFLGSTPSAAKLQAIFNAPAPYVTQAIEMCPPQVVEEAFANAPHLLVQGASKWGSRLTSDVLSCMRAKVPDIDRDIIALIAEQSPSYYQYGQNEGTFKLITAAIHCGLIDAQMSQLKSSLKYSYQRIDPVNAAYESRDSESLHLLKEGGYDFRDDMTIFSAVKDGRKEFIALLFELGVNPDLKNAKGGTLMQQTKEADIKDIIKSAKANYAIRASIGQSQENEQINKKTKKTNISSL